MKMKESNSGPLGHELTLLTTKPPSDDEKAAQKEERERGRQRERERKRERGFKFSPPID